MSPQDAKQPMKSLASTFLQSIGSNPDTNTKNEILNLSQFLV
jgi:hypothetical protein